MLERETEAAPRKGLTEGRQLVTEVVEFMILGPAILQVGSYSWVLLLVTVMGAFVFLLVAYLRLKALLHTPRVIGTKPSSGPVQIPTQIPVVQTTGAAYSGPPQTVGLDSGELQQAKARWEDLIREAQTNESLTDDQRQSIIEEARKRVSDIDRSLANA